MSPRPLRPADLATRMPRPVAPRWSATVAWAAAAVFLVSAALSGCGKSRPSETAGGAAPATTARSAAGGAAAPSPGPGKASRPSAGAKATPAAAHPPQSPRADSSDAANPPGAALRSRRPMDVLVRAVGPAYDATALDATLTPLLAALRRAPGVQRVWSRADAGEVRLVVRCDGTRRGAEAERMVRQTWAAHRPAELAPPTVRAIVPGQRAVAALTVIANDGKEAATRLLDQQINPIARSLPNAARVWTAGAVRRYAIVQWMPPYLARWGVQLSVAQAALSTALRSAGAAPPTDAPQLSLLLAETTVSHHAGIAGKQVTLADLSVTLSGVGEPIRGAWTGQRQVVSGIVEAGQDALTSELGAQISHKIVHGKLRKLPKTIEHFYHALAVMRRFRLIRKASAAPSTAATWRRSLAKLGASPLFHDVVALAGDDGVPASLQPEAIDGQRWTLWLAAGAGVRTEQVLATLAEVLPGWRVVPIPPAQDTALAWLLRTPLTAAAVFASHDSPRLGKAVTELTLEFAKETRIATRHTGPHRGRTSAGYGKTRRDVAQKNKLAAADLSLAVALARGPQRAGRVGTTPVWSALPSGVMAARRGELPLRIGHSSGQQSARFLPWSQVLQARDASEDTARLRLNGMPVLWYGATPKEDAAEEFAMAFWTAAEQQVEPSRRMEVRSLTLGQAPLSRAQRARPTPGSPAAAGH